MKILVTSYYYNKHKEDILEIGRALEILEGPINLDEDGILCTWIKTYNYEVIYDINCIAQVLRIIKEEFHLPWRDIK